MIIIVLVVVVVVVVQQGLQDLGVVKDLEAVQE
jgi:hypothetical protein